MIKFTRGMIAKDYYSQSLFVEKVKRGDVQKHFAKEYPVVKISILNKYYICITSVYIKIFKI